MCAQTSQAWNLHDIYHHLYKKRYGEDAKVPDIMPPILQAQDDLRKNLEKNPGSRMQPISVNDKACRDVLETLAALARR